MSGAPLELRWWHRAPARVAMLVGAVVLIERVVMWPVFEWMFRQYHTEGDVPTPEWAPGEFYAYWGLEVASATLIATLLSLVASRYATGRLRGLAAQASEEADSELPGPFEERGRDEITQLARALNGMRGRVQELLQRLEERDARRNEWVAQVSHDLRTPLTALIASLEHTEALLENGGGDAAALRDNNAAARLDAERVAALAEDLLDIARLEVDGTIDAEPVLVGEVVDRVVRGLEPLARREGVVLEARVERGLAPLEADGRLLLRALENLVMNSIQHAKGHVLVSVAKGSGGLRVDVEDDGEGFPAVNGAVDFAALRARRSRADSAGLGLIVTQRVVAAHGGHVEAKNLEGGGASIGFALPVD